VVPEGSYGLVHPIEKRVIRHWYIYIPTWFQDLEQNCKAPLAAGGVVIYIGLTPM